jgi:hypothetical protein
MATLRPLFQAFLSRTKLWGSTTARAKSSGYGHSKSRSRGLSGSGIGGRKGYIRSGSKGNITLQTDMEGDEVGLKDMISPTADKNEKAGRERGNLGTITTINDGNDNPGSLRSQASEWDLERGENHTGRKGEWPIAVTKTVQTKVTSWRVEEDEIPVGMGSPRNGLGGGNGRRQSNSHATSAGW